MERVQEALERARQQRQGVIGSQPEARRGATAYVGGPGHNDERTALTSIAYTQTQRVELSDAVLNDNRVIAGFEQDARVEPYRALRSQVLRKMSSENWHTLAITRTLVKR